MATLTAVPRVVHSAESRARRRPTFEDCFKIREAVAQASIDEAGRTARVIIISEGLGNLKDRNYYMASAVESAVKAFEGRQFYVDHPSASEDKDRPERSVRDLAGYFSDCAAGTTKDADTGETLAACFATLHFAESEPGNLAFAQVKTALEYQQKFPSSKDVYAGISINAGGVSHPGTVDGMPVNVVTEIREAFSADIVTKPARGGKFLATTRESVVVSGNAAIAARVARWKRTHRESGRSTQAWIGREADMAIVKTKGKHGKVREARKRATRKFTESLTGRIKKAVEAEKIAEATAAKLRKVIEAGGKLPRAMTAEGASALAERLKAAGAMMGAEAEGEDGGATDLISDILQDVDELKAALAGGGGAPKPAPAPEAEGEGEDEDEAEGEDEDEDEAEGEDEDEDEAEDEDEDEGAGMGPDAGADGPPQTMKYKCASCEAENEVVPPKGFKLSPSGAAEAEDEDEDESEGRAAESARGGTKNKETAALRETVKRIRRQLIAKESRFAEASKAKRRLLLEAITLRAENQGYKIRDLARSTLRENEIPPHLLSVGDLLAYHPSQWGIPIKSAKFAKRMEAKRIAEGGHWAGGGKLTRTREAEPASSAEAFDKAYTKK